MPPAPALARVGADVEKLRSVIEAPKRKLGRRPKFEEQPRADASFVNVLVELCSERSDVPPDVQSKERKHLDAILDPAVASAKRASLAAAKLPGAFVSATVPVSKLEDLQEHPAVSFVHPSDPLKLDAPPAPPQTASQERRRSATRRRADAGGVS